jgi:hypothetical protein
VKKIHGNGRSQSCKTTILRFGSFRVAEKSIEESVLKFICKIAVQVPISHTPLSKFALIMCHFLYTKTLIGSALDGLLDPDTGGLKKNLNEGENAAKRKIIRHKSKIAITMIKCDFMFTKN